MKTAARFYKTVSVCSCQEGFEIQLDGRRLKTPGKMPLTVSSQALADLIAAEWDAQIETINPETMPITRLINVAIERTPINRDALIAEARKYAETDLLCYRAVEPPRLAKRQSQAWDPVLNWAEGRGITMQSVQGIVAVDQAEHSLDKIADYAKKQNDIRLTLLVHFTAVFGSVILAIAVMEKHLTALEALTLSRLDEIFQIEQWGEDEEALIRTKNIEDESIALASIISAL